MKAVAHFYQLLLLLVLVFAVFADRETGNIDAADTMEWRKKVEGNLESILYFLHEIKAAQIVQSPEFPPEKPLVTSYSVNLEEYLQPVIGPLHSVIGSLHSYLGVSFK